MAWAMIILFLSGSAVTVPMESKQICESSGETMMAEPNADLYLIGWTCLQTAGEAE